jgi:hypothetical protein
MIGGARQAAETAYIRAYDSAVSQRIGLKLTKSLSPQNRNDRLLGKTKPILSNYASEQVAMKDACCGSDPIKDRKLQDFGGGGVGTGTSPFLAKQSLMQACRSPFIGAAPDAYKGTPYGTYTLMALLSLVFVLAKVRETRGLELEEMK